MRILVDLTEAVVIWLQLLDSYIGFSLDDRLSVLLYNMEVTGDNSWIDFLTQSITAEDSSFHLYEFTEPELEEEIAEQVGIILNNPINDHVRGLGYEINRMEAVNVVKTPHNGLTVYGLLEVQPL